MGKFWLAHLQLVVCMLQLYKSCIGCEPLILHSMSDCHSSCILLAARRCSNGNPVCGCLHKFPDVPDNAGKLIC